MDKEKTVSKKTKIEIFKFRGWAENLNFFTNSELKYLHLINIKGYIITCLYS